MSRNVVYSSTQTSARLYGDANSHLGEDDGVVLRKKFGGLEEDWRADDGCSDDWDLSSSSSSFERRPVGKVPLPRSRASMPVQIQPYDGHKLASSLRRMSSTPSGGSVDWSEGGGETPGENEVFLMGHWDGGRTRPRKVVVASLSTPPPSCLNERTSEEEDYLMPFSFDIQIKQLRGIDTRPSCVK